MTLAEKTTHESKARLLNSIEFYHNLCILYMSRGRDQGWFVTLFVSAPITC